jgi:hypothetical protein
VEEVLAFGRNWVFIVDLAKELATFLDFSPPELVLWVILAIWIDLE